MSWDFTVYLEKLNKETNKWELSIKEAIYSDGKWYILENDPTDKNFESRRLRNHFDSIKYAELSEELRKRYADDPEATYTTISYNEYCKRVDAAIDQFSNEEKFIMLAQGMKLYDGEIEWDDNYEKDVTVPILKNLIYNHCQNTERYEKALKNRGMLNAIKNMSEKFYGDDYEPFESGLYRFIFVAG